MNLQIYKNFGKRNHDLIPFRKRIQTPNRCVYGEHESKMKHYKGLFFVLLVSIAIISGSNCTRDPAKVALKTNDKVKGIAAVQMLTDEEELTKVALEANRFDVREAAVEKLTDQTQLEKISYEAEDSNIFRIAMYKLTDPVILVKIAMDNKIGDYRRKVAITRLTYPAIMKKLAVMNNDSNVQQFYELILAFDIVPLKYRARRIANVLPAIDILNDPEVINIVGKINSVKIGWSREKQSYYAEGIKRRVTVHGERFKCLIKLTNLSKPLSHTWSTFFPGVISETATYFRPAKINIGDILLPVFDQLPQSMLTKIALEDGDVNKAAVKKLHDQTLLLKIAFEGKTSLVRQRAVARLTDQSLLIKIAIKCNDEIACRVAIRKLTDQPALAKIAMEAWKTDSRKAAIDKLIDQSILAKIALESDFFLDREAAVEKLTDQSILARIAVEDKYASIRLAAVEKLTDQPTLAKIAVKDKKSYIRYAAQKKLDALRNNEQ